MAFLFAGATSACRLPAALAAWSAFAYGAAGSGVAWCSSATSSCDRAEDISMLQARTSMRSDAPPTASTPMRKSITHERHMKAMERMYFERMGMAGPVPGGTLPPGEIPKFVTPLVIPPAVKSKHGDEYTIELRQFKQQILPGGIWNNRAFGLLPEGKTFDFPATTVWSYGPTQDPAPDSSDLGGGAGIAPAQNSQFNYPAYTMEATKDRVTTVEWANGLVRDPVTCRACRRKEQACLRLCELHSADASCRTRCAKGKDPDNGSCNFLPHLLPVDQTLHWANPGRLPCNDMRRSTDCTVNASALRNSTSIQEPYAGPVPMIVHVHGGRSTPESDGYPEAWYLPDASDIPEGYARDGTFVNKFARKTNTPGAARFVYKNTQPSTTLWFHDHTLGMTRLNVYAGPAGFWLIRDKTAKSGETGLLHGELPGPAPKRGEGLAETNLPGVRERYREIPIVIQDRSFNRDGSLFYPDNRSFFSWPKQLHIPYIGSKSADSDIPPIWNPEAFFNVMVVNGVSWPAHKVKRGLYRFRLLNGCNSRFLNLFLVTIPGGSGSGTQVPMYQIGGDQSLLPKVVKITLGHKTVLPGDGTEPASESPTESREEALLLAPAERADIIVDFSDLPAGTVVRMLNTAPDAPFSGFPDTPADPDTTGQVMEFHIGDESCGSFTKPRDLVLSLPDRDSPAAGCAAPDNSRDVTLLELSSTKVCVTEGDEDITYDPDAVPISNDECVTSTGGNSDSLPFGPKAVVLGVQDASGGGKRITLWSSPIATNPGLGSTEEWVIWNDTPDAHPIHLHLVKFRVQNREDFDENTGVLSGLKLAPSSTEAGWKDTVIAYPLSVTRVRATFERAGLYVWHCHLLEHEDNEMMVPYCVGDMHEDPACRLHNSLAHSHTA